VNYAEAAAQPGLEQQGLGVNEDRAEIRTAGALALTERWALLGQIRYDLEEDRRLTDAVGLRYQDDCFMLSVQYAQSEIKDRDIEPEQTIMLNFSLKYLGTYSVQSEVMGMVGPDGSDLDNP
jgi:LPS-assembly protein